MPRNTIQNQPDTRSCRRPLYLLDDEAIEFFNCQEIRVHELHRRLVIIFWIPEDGLLFFRQGRYLCSDTILPEQIDGLDWDAISPI